MLRGINCEVKNDSFRVALKKSGYKLRRKQVRWPRARGAKFSRREVTTEFVAGFVH
jgi:hypothetical protein